MIFEGTFEIVGWDTMMEVVEIFIQQGYTTAVKPKEDELYKIAYYKER